MTNLLKISKWLHKYIGLFLLVFLLWMSVSGVLLNHRDLISGFSVPGWLVPPQYDISNWNRSALTTVIFSGQHPSLAFGSGKQGIWKSSDAGRTFQPFMDGLPDSRYYRKTAHMLLMTADSGDEWLLAGTNRGLYERALNHGSWRQISLGSEIKPVKKILHIDHQVVVLTESRAYSSGANPGELRFEPARFTRDVQNSSVSLIDLFFHLHDGRIWGLPGKLLFDAVGLILFFLSLSAFYSWYYPWKRRREKTNGVRTNPGVLRRAFKWFLKYHLKLGIWTAAILLIIGGTGIFMRPPLLAALADGKISGKWYPGMLPDNPWHEKIHNALYDSVEHRIVVDAKDGMWAGPADFSGPFREIELPVPIFIMGATVFEPKGTGGYLVGSFGGIYYYDRAAHKSVDVFTGRKVEFASALRPAKLMVTGYFETPHGEPFVTTHREGLLPLGKTRRNNRFALPDEMTSGFRMPLWNFLFEIHNGRIFEHFIGSWYILLAPLGAFLFVLITLSGVVDWLYLKFRHA